MIDLLCEQMYRENVICQGVTWWVREDTGVCQLDLFTDYEALEKERKIQGAMLEIHRRYGANAVLKGMNLLKGAMTKERNTQIGGHKA